MRDLVLGAVGASVIFLAGSPALAQDTCSDVLKPGTDMSVRFHQTDQFQQALYQRFRSMTFQQSQHETGLGLSVPIGEAVMGSANYSEAEFNARREQIDNLYATQTHRFRSIDYELDAHDPEVLAAWRECMGHQARLIIWFNRPTATQATMTLDWLNANTSQTEVRLIQDVNLRDGVRAAPSNCLSAGYVYSVGRPCTVDLELRAADTSALISANTTNGTAQTYLPPRLKLVRHREMWNPLPTPECQGAPPDVGTGPSGPWIEWGLRCPARAITYIKRNSTKGNAILELPPELRASGWRFDTDPAVAPHVTVLKHWRAKSPLVAGYEGRFSRRSPAEHQVEDRSDNGEVLRITDDGLGDLVVQVAQGRDIGSPTVGDLRAIAALHVLGQGVGIVFRLAEHDLQHELAIGVVLEGVGGEAQVL